MAEPVYLALHSHLAIDLRGRGRLAGDLPEGAAKILNVPARVCVHVYEARSGRLVDVTYSDSAGRWELDYLSLDVQYRVVGVDPLRNVNSAIQDWVYAAPMEP